MSVRVYNSGRIDGTVEKHTHTHTSHIRQIEVVTSNINRIFNTLNPMIRYFICIYSSVCLVWLTFPLHISCSRSISVSVYLCIFLKCFLFILKCYQVAYFTHFCQLSSASSCTFRTTTTTIWKKKNAQNNHQKRVRDLGLFCSFLLPSVYFNPLSLCFIFYGYKIDRFLLLLLRFSHSFFLSFSLLVFRFVSFKCAHGFRFGIAHLMFGWLIIRYKMSGVYFQYTSYNISTLNGSLKKRKNKKQTNKQTNEWTYEQTHIQHTNNSSAGKLL